MFWLLFRSHKLNSHVRGWDVSERCWRRLNNTRFILCVCVCERARERERKRSYIFESAYLISETKVIVCVCIVCISAFFSLPWGKHNKCFYEIFNALSAHTHTHTCLLANPHPLSQKPTLSHSHNLSPSLPPSLFLSLSFSYTHTHTHTHSHTRARTYTLAFESCSGRLDYMSLIRDFCPAPSSGP